MAKLSFRCKMQDNGFKQQCGRELTLKECRELFECDKDGAECNNCTVLEVVKAQ